MNKQVLKGGLFVFLGACSFGMLSTVTKTAYSYNYTVGQITGVQTFFGFLILWLSFGLQNVFVPSTIKKSIEGEKKDAAWKIILAGSFTGLVGICYYMSIQLLPASVAIILLMQYLWITLLIEFFVFKKKPSQVQLIATIFAIFGTVFAGGLFDGSIEINAKGVLFGMLAALAYSIFLLTSGRVGNNLPVIKKSALIVTGSCLITWLIFPPQFLVDGTIFGGLFKWGLLLALMGGVLPPLFFSMGIPKTGVALGAIISAVELPAAVLTAYFVLSEGVSSWRWLGVALILFAIILPNLIVLPNLKGSPSNSFES